ncbi:HAD-IA family hydrolase [Geodermatophilus ruber]|uniref:HAD-IA family hydrolase n=1 Tax=Geodermatophilus ruber TaxID=504800 RepID=UPI0011608642|nr:HAD-IA family hydrolase [Geodermatophilus ruber]
MIEVTQRTGRRAVLFDVDGVLVDSYTAYRRVWDRWASLRGLEPDVVWAATHARRPLETVAEVAPLLDPAAEYTLLRKYVAGEGNAFPLYPGAAALLAELPLAEWAIVTSGRSATVCSRLTAGGAPSPMVLVDTEAVTRGKPDPEGYLLAARLLGVDPASCLVVEDAPAGVEAGLAAGMRVLALATTHEAAVLVRAHEVAASLHRAAPLIRNWLGPS